MCYNEYMIPDVRQNLSVPNFWWFIGVKFSKFHDFSMTFDDFSKFHDFPWLFQKILFFQVFQVFQTLWEPCQWAQHFPNHHELIRKVSQGLLISFWDEAPPFIHGPLVLSYNNKEEAISLAVQKLLKSQAIEEVQDTSSPAFYGRLFFVPKPDGFLCPIIDLDCSSFTTPGMDDQNRFEGCLPTYHSTSKYPQVLPACGKLSD